MLLCRKIRGYLSTTVTLTATETRATCEFLAVKVQVTGKVRENDCSELALIPAVTLRGMHPTLAMS